MADLEESALPLLQWMMMGRAVSLDTHAQSLVAKWLALRALVFRYIEEPITPPERGWLDYFYEHQLPPPTCYQWITAYNGEKPFHYAGNDILVSRSPGKERRPSWETPHGILMTFVVGYLAAKLIWIRKGEPGNLDPPGLVRIWPTNDTPVIWPPATAIDEAGLEALTKMFLSTP